MSKLTELEIGAHAIIKDINADDELKHRLLSMGIQKNVEIKVKGYSLGKKVFKIDANHTALAIRKEEADKIEVDRR